MVIQPGDTLSQIAQNELGDADLYPQLAAANAIADPDVITAGSVIIIPTLRAALIWPGSAEFNTEQVTEAPAADDSAT